MDIKISIVTVVLNGERYRKLYPVDYSTTVSPI
jgi:hypothetical protein